MNPLAQDLNLETVSIIRSLIDPTDVVVNKLLENINTKNIDLINGYITGYTFHYINFAVSISLNDEVYCFCFTGLNEIIYVNLDNWINHGEHILTRRCCIYQPYLIDGVIPNFPLYFNVGSSIYFNCIGHLLYIDPDKTTVRRMIDGEKIEPIKYHNNPEFKWIGINTAKYTTDKLITECCRDHYISISGEAKVLNVFYFTNAIKIVRNNNEVKLLSLCKPTISFLR